MAAQVAIPVGPLAPAKTPKMAMTMKRASGCFRLTVERGSSSFEK
jgi:hypothetical protein